MYFRPRNARRPVLLVFLVLAGCGSLFGPDDVEIRVRNVSSIAFDEVLVRFGSQTEEYGRLPAGEATGYRSIEQTYREVPVEVTVAGQTFATPPIIDHVGESFLGAGRYTYELDLLVDEGTASLRVVDE